MSGPPVDPTPYRPPPIDGRAPRPPLRLRAVATGIAVDWAGTLAASFLILLMAGMVAASRYPDEAQIEAFLERLTEAPDFAILSSFVGLVCVSLGGYVAGRLARDDEVRHAALMGVASFGIGLAFELSTDAAPRGWNPVWLRVVGHALVIPAAYVGGLAARARNRHVPRDDDAT